VIGSSLDAGTTITWAGTAYLMGQAACQPLYGRLSDVFGRKPVLMLSLAFIVIGGLLCGFAQTPTWLYVCRALSGVGGGGVSSVVAIIISDLVSMRDRGKYQGLLSVAIGLGACAGPFIAAEMLKRGGEAWRWIFWVSPILASVCLVVMWFLLPLKPVTGSWGEKVRKIDWFGVVVAVVAMVFLLVSWFLLSRLIRGMVWLTRSVAAHQLRRIDVALEQRHGDIDALHWRRQLAPVLLYPETSGQDPHHPFTTFHPKINFGLVAASTMLRLCVASRPVFLAALLSGCSRLHTASVSNTHVAIARDA
jgi:MFS family permease